MVLAGDLDDAGGHRVGELVHEALREVVADELALVVDRLMQRGRRDEPDAGRTRERGEPLAIAAEPERGPLHERLAARVGEAAQLGQRGVAIGELLARQRRRREEEVVVRVAHAEVVRCDVAEDRADHGSPLYIPVGIVTTWPPGTASSTPPASCSGRVATTPTSPRAVLRASGAGQGSLYHFFPTKADLGRAAIAATVEEALELARADLRGDELPVMARVERYLRRPRPALRGCPVGRLAGDPDVRDDERLHEPVGAVLRRALEAAHRRAGRGEGARRARARCEPRTDRRRPHGHHPGRLRGGPGLGGRRRYDSVIAGGLALLDALTIRS